MMIRSKILEMLENADRFKLKNGNLSFKDGEVTFVVVTGDTREIPKTRIEIKSDSKETWLIFLNKEESNLLNPIFSIVLEIRKDEREMERRKECYKKQLAYIIEERKKQMELNKLLEKTDFTKESNNEEENKENGEK